MKNHYPLILNYKPEAPLIYDKGRWLTQGELLTSALQLAELIPQNAYVINFCSERYYFLLTFMAVLIRNSTNILPHNKQLETVAEIVADFPSALCIVDHDRCPSSQYLDLRQQPLRTDSPLVVSGEITPPFIPFSHVAAIAFTSGSTGKPKPQEKHWQSLAGAAQLLGERFNTYQTLPCITATTPSQHMYGLEMTVMMSLQAGCCLNSEHPFFPQDVKASLAKIPTPVMLVTTPVHLRALLGSGLDFSAINHIVCATAPLDQEQALLAEKNYGCVLNEIYGCTEAGSLATRRSSAELQWQLLDGVTLQQEAEQFFVSGPQLLEPKALSDQLAIHTDATFSLLGRSSDMLNIGGKRSSLLELNKKLLQVEGVEDGVVFLPSAEDGKRPAAFVVSERSQRDIVKALAEKIDPVFLPRPLRKVQALPRNESGKLLVQQLNKLLEQTAVK